MKTGTFEDPLELIYLDGRNWKVLVGFRFLSSELNREILIPPGFETDFASVPRFFWRLFPPTGRYGKAAVVHDYLYRTPTFPVSKAQADLVFREGMETLGVDAFTVTVLYNAVRFFGGGSFKPRRMA